MDSIIALDTMIFIYLFEEDPRYIKSVEPIFRQIESGQTKCITSVISVIESLSPSKYQESPVTVTQISRFFRETPNLEVYPVNLEIAEAAAELRRNFQILKTPDSVQLATAIIHGAKSFMTNDDKITRLKIPNIKILTPFGGPEGN